MSQETRVRLSAALAVAAMVLLALGLASVTGGSTPAEATISNFEVRKVVIPSDDPGRFDLLVDGTPIATNVSDGGLGGTFIPDTETVTVSETLGDESPAGLELDDYVTTIFCELTGVGSSENKIVETVSVTGTSLVLELNVFDVVEIDCTITNERIPPPPDCDNDGIADDLEELFGTDPCNADTDGDGRNDGDELFIDNTDPTDPTNTPPPFAPPPSGILTCPQPGAFSPPLGPDPTPTILGLAPEPTLTIFGGGTVGEFQDAIFDAGYQSGTFTFQNGLRATIPSDPNDPTFFVFFGGLADVETTLTVTDTLTGLRAVEIPPCTPTFLSSDADLIFSDGFESGDTSTWSSTVP